MTQIKLASGRIMDCDYMGHSDVHKQANVRIRNASIPEIASVFANPDETMQMYFEGDYAIGFTKLMALIDDGDAIRVVLGKE